MTHTSFSMAGNGKRRAGGFSIIELMVSVVIGLLALMFATRLITGGEQNKQAALGGSDAMQNGMMAMFSISSDIKQAGFGLNDPIISGCDTLMLDNGGAGFQMAPATRGTAAITPLSAAVIESNGLNPDRITFYTGGNPSGTPSVRLIQAYDGGSTLAVDRNPFGFVANDVIVVAPEASGARCSLVQLSETPTATTLRFAAGSGRRYNNGTLGVAFTAKSRVFDLGPAKTLSFHSWSVADGFLQLSATDIAGSEVKPATVADNIVSIKAQYGFDTRSGALFQPETSMQIKQWSGTMIDADGDGSAGSVGDYQRIAAIRLAVVARSKAPERAKPGQACAATPDANAPAVFKTSQPNTVAPAPIKPTVAVAGDPVEWHCYRYRVFETIVPIRNNAWRPTAWAK